MISASTVTEVANEFIQLGLNDTTVPPVDQMKLQKLLFYAQAWYLANYNAPLFENDFEAWQWGPVVREIYSKTKKFGKQKLTHKLSTFIVTETGIESITPNGVTDTEVRSFINYVWENYKKFTGIQLSNSTHANGEPWTVIYENSPSLDNNPTIHMNIIRDIFAKKLEADDAA